MIIHYKKQEYNKDLMKQPADLIDGKAVLSAMKLSYVEENVMAWRILLKIQN